MHRPAATARRSRLLLPVVVAALLAAGALPARADPPDKATVTSCTEVGLLAEIASGAAEITFDCGAATIALSQTLVISRALRIDGEGLITLTRSGAGRVVNVTAAVLAADPAELAGLTISGGAASGPGGAILNEGALALEDVVLADNRADTGGAVHSLGPLAATRAIFARNHATAGGGAISTAGAGRATLTDVRLDSNSAGAAGGAISAASPITITGSLLRGNSAESGGALALAGGAALVRDSELSANRATAAGGAVVSSSGLTLTGVTVAENSAATGGGIDSSGALTLRSSTVSGNRTTGNGGGIASRGTLTLSAATVAANQAGVGGGGIYIPSGSATARGSIIAGNGALVGLDCLGPLGSAGGNLLQRTEGCVLAPPGDLVNVDPRLEPLADNGGPTRTHALPQSSPAVDALPPASCPTQTELTDQRGVNRPIGAGCDIGAYELGFVVTSLADAPDQLLITPDCAAALPGSPCTLRAAIQQANNLFGRQAISFAIDGTFSLNPAMVANEDDAVPDLDIIQNHDLIIIGRGAGKTVIDGGDSPAVGGLLDIAAGASVWISGVTLRGGNAGASTAGGAIRSAGTLDLRDSLVTANRTADGSGRGGGIANSGTLRLTRVTVSANTAGSGAGIDSTGRLLVADSTISANTATSTFTGGGGINSRGEMRLTNVTLSGNSAAHNGGGLVASGGPRAARLNNLTIAGNTANSDADEQGDGGGLFAPLSDVLVVANTLIAGNSDGGGLPRPDCAGAFTSLGYNMVRIDTECVATRGAGDRLGTAGAPLDVRLGSFGANGGPTQTYRLLSDSPAINGGSPAPAYAQTHSCAASDQRGGARPIGARCDVGASEVPLADLRLAQVVATGGAAMVGRSLSYTIAVSNDGPSATGAVVLTVSLPNAALVGSSASQGSCSPAPSGASCALGTLASGETASVNLAVRPLRTGQLPTISSVQGVEADPSTSNNTAGAQNTVGYGLLLPLVSR